MSINATQKITLKLVVAAVGMFVFAVFLMPPLYDVFCEITGIGGKTAGQYEGEAAAIDAERVVKVQFVATNNGAMSWEFAPVEYQVRVHPGEKTAVEFYARNPTARAMTAQAIPNVTPNNAAEFFHKTECFCFNKQSLGAGEETNMGLVFIVDPELPATVTTITLSYTLFDVSEEAEPAVAVAN
jgi:cytochrome c oxidase assembly protein subunit 11